MNDDDGDLFDWDWLPWLLAVAIWCGLITHARDLREYFDLGSKMKEICGRMAEIRDELQRRSDTNFPSMFVDVARQLLPEEEFERIKRYALFRLHEIYDQVD